MKKIVGYIIYIQNIPCINIIFELSYLSESEKMKNQINIVCKKNLFILFKNIYLLILYINSSIYIQGGCTIIIYS